MTSYLRAAVHVAWLIVFICVLEIDFLPAEYFPVPGSYISKLAWLTVINLYLQVGYHACASYLSLTSSQPNSVAVNRFHFVSTAIIQPIALVVGVLFWTLYLIDPKLLVPQNLPVHFKNDSFRNHSQHSFPAFSMLIDHILWAHHRPTKLGAFKALLVFAMIYVIDIHVAHAISGRWAYGIMGELSLPFRMLFILTCVFVLYLAFLIGDKFNETFHRTSSNIKAIQPTDEHYY